jgi:hypothetical protein
MFRNVINKNSQTVADGTHLGKNQQTLFHRFVLGFKRSHWLSIDFGIGCVHTSVVIMICLFHLLTVRIDILTLSFSGEAPELPRPKASGPKLASRSSTRGPRGWRESKGKILGMGEKGVSADFQAKQPSNPDKCANLQASCKCGGASVSDPEQAVDILLKDAEVYNPIFEALMNFLVNEAAGKTDAKFDWHKPRVVTAPIKGKPRCVEKIKQK